MIKLVLAKDLQKKGPPTPASTSLCQAYHLLFDGQTGGPISGFELLTGEKPCLALKTQMGISVTQPRFFKELNLQTAFGITRLH